MGLLYGHARKVGRWQGERKKKHFPDQESNLDHGGESAES